MALKIKLAETKIVLLNLLICLVVFYTVYYVVLSICFTAFRLEVLNGLAPFDFKTKPSWINPNYLVLLLSLEITYFMCGLLFVLVVEEWVWDYAITVTVIHIAITSAVMSEFPLMLHWWVALVNGKTPANFSVGGGVPTWESVTLRLKKKWWKPVLQEQLTSIQSGTEILSDKGSGFISMICGGQILAYCLFKDNFIYPVLDDF